MKIIKLQHNLTKNEIGNINNKRHTYPTAYKVMNRYHINGAGISKLLVSIDIIFYDVQVNSSEKLLNNLNKFSIMKRFAPVDYS